MTSGLFWKDVVGCSVTSMPGICTVCTVQNTLSFGSHPNYQAFGHRERLSGRSRKQLEDVEI